MSATKLVISPKPVLNNTAEKRLRMRQPYLYCELDENLFRTFPKAQNGGKKE
jgi:hypothetical protein